MEKLVLLRNLMQMARADGRIDDAEQQLLDSHRRKWGISQDDFDELLRSTATDERSLFIPESTIARQETLVEMTLMMAADGHIDDLELELLRNAAERMDVQPERLDEIIAEFTDSDDDLLISE